MRHPVCGGGTRAAASSAFGARLAGVCPSNLERETKLHAQKPSPGRLILRATAVALIALVMSGVSAQLALAATKKPSIAAYKGLGSWVDIYEDKAWGNPVATVQNMKSHGVRTLYLETGNSRQKTAIFNPTGQAAFIKAAHARGMKVVAWYLPELKNGTTDYNRIAAAIKFRTSDGQRFDSFALDIESSAVTPVSTRNSRLDALTKKIRKVAGASYPLGAIIPSPVGISKNKTYWKGFPYKSLAAQYNVFVPMSYYTYHGKGAAAATSDTLSNVRIIRAQPGCKTIPIHLIGGIADDSTTAEVKAFVAATQKAKVNGASLYSWTGTTAADWKALSAIKVR